MVEKTATNGNSVLETEKAPTATASRSRKTPKAANGKETMALSVKEEKPGPIALPGNRPIEASHLDVVNTYHSVDGDRPVVASGLDVKGTLTISGSRPIVSSHLQISETYTVMGDRPVAPNDIDDPATLMGFLD
ncbi:MAG: hypothetical protein AB4041_08520 [Microcystaceae cyanobacterium]